MTDNRKRRKFLKSAGAVVAGSAITSSRHGPAVAGGKPGGCDGGPGLISVRHDRHPYQVNTRTYQRFSQADTVFNRPRTQGVDIEARLAGGLKERLASSPGGFSLVDAALFQAAMSVGRRLSFVDSVYDFRLDAAGYSFPDAAPAPVFGRPRASFDSPAEATQAVKRAARFLGADLVGVCRLDPRWLYRDVWLDDEKRSAPLELPGGLTHAVVLAVSMDYRTIAASPTALSAAEVARGYSRMMTTATSLASFLRGLGYTAVASGNDTALSVPLAIDAGLGEMSRMGMLVTPEFGPRVRLAKVFTDLPLHPARPVSLGVREFCRKCMKCARRCPAAAIPFDHDPSWEGRSTTTNPGVLKWYVDGERCLDFWFANGADCITCVAVCPYSKPREVWRPEAGTGTGFRGRRLLVNVDTPGTVPVTDEDPATWWSESEEESLGDFGHQATQE